MLPKDPETGIGYSPPARKLAVSPDKATRLGSARLRAMPFCSRALIITSVVTPLDIMRPTRKPNGDEFERTPAAVSPAIVAAVRRRLFGETRLPILVIVLSPNRFH